MKAKKVHEKEEFTRGGDPYRKMGLGDQRYSVRAVKGAHIKQYNFITPNAAGTKEERHWIEFPAVDWSGQLVFGYVEDGITQVTDDPYDDRVTHGTIYWPTWHVDQKLKDILEDHFRENFDELVSDITEKERTV